MSIANLTEPFVVAVKKVIVATIDIISKEEHWIPDDLPILRLQFFV